MKIVLDTNVFVSGIFFSGPPHRILRAWREGLVRVAYSPAMLSEYERVLAELAEQFPGVSVEPFLGFLARYGERVESARVPGLACRDSDDLKFLECLLASKALCLVTGDKDLLDIQPRPGLILTPRQFCSRYL
jgi:putative PIN family toxin of toxin-antitoxin system